MRNKLLFLLCVFLACFGSAKADIWINSVYFPDSGFRTWVQKHFDKPNGAKLTDEELASVKEIISDARKECFERHFQQKCFIIV